MLKHKKVSPKSDSSDVSIIQPSDWNDNHSLEGVGVIYGELPNGEIRSAAAGGNYLWNLRRKFNGAIKEEYEFFEPPDLISTDYDFDEQTSEFSLIALTLNTVTLTPVPLGINGTDVDHFIYIYDPVGGSEVVKIEGGNAISGSATGTIFIRPGLNHSLGAYTIKSATAGIQEAITFLPSTGGKIKIPRGSHQIYATVTLNKNNIKLTGTGFYSTEITSYYNNGPLIFINSTGVYIEHLCVRGIGLTNGNFYGIVIGTSVRSWIRYVNISECAGGIQVQNIDASDANTIESCWISYFSKAGVEILGSNSTYLLNVFCVGGQGPLSYGFIVKKTGGLQLINCFSFNNSIGMIVSPDAGAAANHIFLTNCVFDFNTQDCLKIRPNNGTISGLFITNSYFAYSKKGIHLANDIGGTVEFVEILGSRIILNKEEGILIYGANLTNIAVDNCAIISNSSGTGNDGLYDGILIIPNNTMDGIRVTNNFIDIQAAHVFQMRCGINLDYPNSTGSPKNILITGNKIGEKVTTIAGEKAYIFGLVGPVYSSLIIKDNLPVNSINYTITVPGAAIAFLGNGANDMFIVTGTQAINRMLPHWNGREIMIVKTDTGNWTFNNTDSSADGFRNANFVLAQNSSIKVKYDGSKWNILSV